MSAGARLTLAVIGASGFIGSQIAREAQSRGHQVLRVSAPRLRWPADAPCSAESAALILGSPEAASALARIRDAVKGADAVINAAGLASPDGEETETLFGGNALWPLVLRTAVTVPLVHLSSAAVLGAGRLHARAETAPFSDYSAAKALGEELLLGTGEDRLCILRATSVQGPERATTKAFLRLARSPLASWAADAPTPLTTRTRLARLTVGLAEDLADGAPVPPIVLQPWEGATTKTALEAARGDALPAPRRVPVPAAKAVLGSLRGAGAVPGPAGQRALALSRRLEVLWFGQEQDEEWPRAAELAGPSEILEMLRAATPGRSPQQS